MTTVDASDFLLGALAGLALGGAGLPAGRALARAALTRWWRRGWLRRYYLGPGGRMSRFEVAPGTANVSEAEQLEAWLREQGLRPVGWARFKAAEA